MAEHTPRAPHHDAGPHHPHVVPVPTYVGVFLALLVLTALTVAAARVDLGPFNTPVALAIAVAKALLVILFFMHVKYGPRLNALAIAAAVFWLFHLVVGTAADYYARDRVNAEDRPAQPFVLEDD
ncbi:MAG TPA: cytochrome C oxidase subunit IV family protein [Vicinamibacteria bacterium]|nr:cytochrome C oxidase subunit IV family protein [Vicinamibacteria bacterium]